MTNDPLFVQISDIHFNINNLELSSSALLHAINKSEELQVPLIVAGDLHDTKAIIRAEVANRLLWLFSNLKQTVYILVGNHDLINEKGNTHGLNYLANYTIMVSSPVEVTISGQEVMLIPYQNTVQAFQDALGSTSKESIVVCHQGVQGAYMGDYVQDKTSIEKQALEGHRLFSGHYHRHQEVGTLVYGGSPFTHSFGEANDGEKGYLIVNRDGSYTREILNLRKHVKIEATTKGVNKIEFPIDGIPVNKNDLLWLKVTGPKSELDTIDKDEWGARIIGHNNYKLDLITNESGIDNELLFEQSLNPSALLDLIIENSGETSTKIIELRKLWRNIL